MLGSPGSHGLAGTRPRCSRSLLSSKAVSSFFPVEPLMLGSPGSHGLAGTRPRCSRSLLSSKAVSSFFPVEPLMLGSPGSHGLAGTRPAISQKPPLTARDAVRGGFEGTAANLYCLANFKRKAFSPQILNRSCLQIRCTVTGGAYHSARRVSMCARSDYKAGACLNCTRRMHQT